MDWEKLHEDLTIYDIRNIHVSCEPPYPMPRPIMNSSPGIKPWLMEIDHIFKDGKSLTRIYYKRDRKDSNEMDGNFN